MSDAKPQYGMCLNCDAEFEVCNDQHMELYRAWQREHDELRAEVDLTSGKKILFTCWTKSRASTCSNGACKSLIASALSKFHLVICLKFDGTQ